MKKILLSLLILLTSSNALVNADSATIDKNKLWDNTKTALYHGGFAIPVVIGTYRHLNSDNILKNNFTQITDEKMVNFVQDACSKITDRKVNIYTGNASVLGLSAGYFAAALGNNNIIIEPSYYQVIKEYFSDKTKENREVSLNIFNFLIQHEANHLKNNDSKKRVYQSIAAYLLKVCLFEGSKKTGIEFKASQLLTYLSLNAIDMRVQSYFNKQQEYRADAGIVGQSAIQGGKQFFTNLINLAQDNPAVYWNMKLDPNHPSPENRLIQLQKLDRTI